MNVLTEEEEKLLNMYEELCLGPPSAPEKTPINYCQDCDLHMVIIECDLYSCPECGATELCNFVEEYQSEYIPPRTFYKRRHYFVEKLKLIAGFKKSNSKGYNKMLDRLKKYEFCEIDELRSIMKRLKLHRYYKHVYNIFEDIKGYRVIDLTYNDVTRLIRKFLDVERKFKDVPEQKRHNLWSYNVIIYKLLKDNNYEGYENIFLPKNAETILDFLENN